MFNFQVENPAGWLPFVLLSGRGHSSLSAQSSKAASGNKCNRLYSSLYSPSRAWWEATAQVGPLSGCSREKSLDSKGLAGRCEGLPVGLGGRDRKSGDALSLNPAALQVWARAASPTAASPFLLPPPLSVTELQTLIFLRVSLCADLWELCFMLSACLWCVLVHCIIYCSVFTFVQIRSLIRAAASLPAAVWTPFSFSLFKSLSQYAFILSFSQPAWLPRTPCRQMELQGLFHCPLAACCCRNPPTCW